MRTIQVPHDGTRHRYAQEVVTPGKVIDARGAQTGYVHLTVEGEGTLQSVLYLVPDDGPLPVGVGQTFVRTVDVGPLGPLHVYVAPVNQYSKRDVASSD